MIGLRVVLLPFFLSHGEYGFSSMGSCYYSREWVWNGIQGQNSVALLWESEMPAEFLYRNLILGICFGFIT